MGKFSLGTLFDRIMRNQIVDKINQIDTDIENSNKRIDNISTTSGNSVTEIVDARVDESGNIFTNLKRHLDDKGAKIKDLQKNFVAVIQFGAKGDGIANDQAALVSAVDYAFKNNKTLLFPDGTYLSDANIPNFHNVTKVGAGVIKRGTDLFYITPKPDQTNKIYVNVSGSSNTYDGISSSAAMRDLQTGFSILPVYASPSLAGNWQFILSAGTHLKKAVVPAGLGQRDFQIQVIGADVGGHPNTPTTIVRQGTGAAAVGLLLTDGTRVFIKDVWFQDFNGSSSSAAISAQFYAKVTTSNVHASNCFYGVSGIKHSTIIVPDGIYDSCGRLPDGSGTGAAFRSLQQNNHAIGIQDSGDRSKTVVVKNCRYGLWAQESSTGHCDWANMWDNEDALVARVNSRINLSGTEFKRNKRAIRTDSLAHVYIPSSVVFAVGAINATTGRGADENENILVVQSNSDVTSADIIAGQEVSASINERWFGIDILQQDISTTSVTKFKTMTLKAPMWRYTPTGIAIGKKLVARIKGTITGSTDAKRVHIRLGNAVASLVFSAGETGSFYAEAEVEFTKINQQLLFIKGNSHLGTNRIGMNYASNDMLSDIDLTLEAQVTNTADKVRIETCQIGWAG